LRKLKLPHQRTQGEDRRQAARKELHNYYSRKLAAVFFNGYGAIFALGYFFALLNK
jgi:hypothetical protein